MEEEEYDKVFKETARKLTKFYKECGFKKVPRSEFMYYNTDYILNVKL
jgi:hypothetical protein